MTQFKAMLIDAYRELNSRKLFWVVLAISTMVMLGYASMGFDETGISYFFGIWHVDNDQIREGSPIARMLYRSIFSTFIVGIWLAWAAVILALISTTTIFPDFIAGGAIDLVLSKPISRLRLFFTKYLLSLLFVLLQVAIFCIGVFLCMGWRTGEWNWLIFAAIPLITLFYSYLYSFNVFIGVWTRSALTALLLTLLLWFSTFGINMAELTIVQIQVGTQLSLEDAVDDRDRFVASLNRIEDTEDNARERAGLQGQISHKEQAAAESKELLEDLDPWMKRIQAVKYVFPKTGETVGLLERWLKRDTDVSFSDIMSNNVTMNEEGDLIPARNTRDRQAESRTIEFYESRSMWYVIGTSLIFEFVMLGLAAFIFVRRDY